MCTVVDDEGWSPEIVGSELIRSGEQTGVPKSAGRVACSVNLQPSQKFAAIGWR